MPPEQPSPPAELPAYVTDPIQRQDPETLEAISDYVADLLAYHRAIEAQSLEDEDIADDGEEVVDIEESAEGTVVTKKQQCGKDCGGCPHGPYRWLVTRDGDSLNWEYLGKATNS